MDKEKSTIIVDEDDIIKFSEKIKQNAREDKNFSNQVDDFMSGKLQIFETLSLGSTPNILHLVGAKSNELTIKQSVLRNCLLHKDEHTSSHSMGHEISVNIIKRLPENLRNPILILKGQHPSTVVVLTELLNNDLKNIIVPIALDLRSTNSTVNKITSIYGKNNVLNYLNKHKDQIIAYNKEKADKLFTTIGYQLSQTTSAICFDNSISYTTQNVNISKENFDIALKQCQEQNNAPDLSAEEQLVNTAEQPALEPIEPEIIDPVAEPMDMDFDFDMNM